MITSGNSSPQSVSQPVEELLLQALALQQAGKLNDAGELYQEILKTQPDNPEANHNMGALAVQMKIPAAGLPYFTAALNADPTRGQYWLSYIDALFQADQRDEAREVMALARQKGLEGKEVDALEAHLDGNSRKEKKPKAAKRDKTSRNSARHFGTRPDAKELNRLVEFFGKGRFTEAAALARTMTERFPRYGAGWKMLGVMLKQLGRNTEALAPMQQAATLLPDDAEAHNLLGISLSDLGHPKEAAVSYRRALQINPNDPQVHSNLGATLQDLGLLEEAEASYRRALEIKPDYAKGHCNLGAILHLQGRFVEAEICLRQALKTMPDSVDAHCNLGVVLHRLDRTEDAEASLRQALRIDPNSTDALGALGDLLFSLGRIAEAETFCREALAINPDLAEVTNTLGSILYSLCRFDEAEASFRRSLAIKPDCVEALSNLSVVLQVLDRLDEAESICRRTLQMKPDWAEAHNCMSVILKDMNRLEEAVVSCRRVLDIKPDWAEAHNNLGSCLHDMGLIEEAEASYRRALKIKPEFALAHSNLLFCLTQLPTLDEKTLFSEHCRFGEQFESKFRGNPQPFTNSRETDRVLQIGFVSGDLNNHSVASFIEPVLVHFSQNQGFLLHAYFNRAIEDDVTRRIQAHFAHWNSIHGLSDKALADKIRADGIDILIDLSGHTAKNRLETFARKPAPVQASWIGYPATTGLRTMDYYISDRHFLPPGQFDDQFTEKIARLPASAPFMPNKDAPPVNALPAQSNGYVTFGSFNKLSKLSPTSIALWAPLLIGLPDSRLLLGGMPDEENCGMLINWFVQHGITRERLIFYPRCDMERYLRLHHQVDICLDTFPYNGGTTTLHAIWMGVPTLSLAGSTTSGRSGASILGHAGLQEFSAFDASDFLNKGLKWGRDIEALADIRAQLRDRFSESAMGRPELVAAGVGRALHIMWQRWCADLPAASFEVRRQDIDQQIK